MMIYNIILYTILSNGDSVVYKRKTVTIQREKFNQLILYIQQVLETVDTLKERRAKKFKLNDWFMAIEIHSEYLNEYLGKIVRENGYKEHIDLIEEWAKGK